MPQTQPTDHTREHYDSIREAKKAYRRDHREFIEQFPEEMRALLPDLGLGQAVTNLDYAVYEQDHGESLTKGQHPSYAVISPSYQTGHRDNIIGPSDSADIGNVLALRIPNGSIMNAEGELNFEGSTYLPLATKLKHIDTVFHAKTTASELLQFAYQYYRNDRKWDALPEGIRDDEYIRDFIRTRWYTYDIVEKLGIKHYEDMLLFDPSDKAKDAKLRKELTTGLPEEARFVRAMAMQMLLWDDKLLSMNEFAPKNTLAVMQGVASKREYVWSRECNKFVAIPETEEDDPNYDRERQSFLAALPEAFRVSKKNGPSISDLLMRGARTFKQFLKLDPEKEALDLYIVSCSDSRAVSIAVAGPLADRTRFSYRVPGAFISLDGKLTKAAGRFFASAKHNKKPVVLAHHLNCGADEAIDAFLGKKGEVPGKFEELAINRQKLYIGVWNKGAMPEDTKGLSAIDPKDTKREQEVFAFYREKYGVRVESIADCMAVQQAIMDYEVAKREYPEVKTYAIIQNVRQEQNLVLNPKTMRFVAVPAADWPAPNQRLAQENKNKHTHRAHSHGCDCGGH